MRDTHVTPRGMTSAPATSKNKVRYAICREPRITGLETERPDDVGDPPEGTDQV